MFRYLQILLILLPAFGYTKASKIPIGIAMDYQFLNHKSYSIGIGVMHYKKELGYKEGWRIDYEYMPKDKTINYNIYGIKLEGFLTYKKYINFGYGLCYFKDKLGYKIIFNPEFGLGYKSIFFIYRRNISLFENNLNYLNKNNLSIRIYIPFDKNWFKLKT